LSGPQAGASIPAKLGKSLLISNDLSGDVMLRDSSSSVGGLLRFRLEIQLQGYRIEVEKGQLCIDEKVVEAGQTSIAPFGTHIVIGETRIAMQRFGDEAATDATPEEKKVDGLVAAAVLPTARSAEALPLASQEKAALPAWARRLVIGGAALFAGSLSMWAVATVVVGSGHTPELKAKQAQALLYSRGWQDARVQADEQGRLAVTGLFISAEERTQAAKTLAAEGFSANMLATVRVSTLDSVRELLRLKGVSAEVEETSPGFVQVKASMEAKHAAALEQMLRTDIAGLQFLDFSNTPPRAIFTNPPVMDDPGKKVVSVVPGEPAYVVTADGARYFVGAILPTGHRIRTIDGRSVVLDRDGLISSLQF
jgi:type III secretion protein D